MAFLDMFDKLDDIIYKPVESICDWIGEPLKKWNHKRDMQSVQQQAQIEAERSELETRLDAQREEDAARLQAEQRKWNAEIDNMIAEQEDARRDRLVEAIKNYQIELASASRDIVNSIGQMSLELRGKANDLVLEKMKAYKKIQDDAKEQSMLELKDAKETFLESDPDTYRILVNDIMQERRSMIETAEKFIIELSEDLKRLNQNSDDLMRMSMNAVNSYLKPMADSLGIASDMNTDVTKRLENHNIIEAEVME